MRRSSIVRAASSTTSRATISRCWRKACRRRSPPSRSSTSRSSTPSGRCSRADADRARRGVEREAVRRPRVRHRPRRPADGRVPQHARPPRRPAVHRAGDGRQRHRGVVYTSGRGEAGQEFTSNKRLLLASVDRFLGRKLRSTTLERLDQYQRQREHRRPVERARIPIASTIRSTWSVATTRVPRSTRSRTSATTSAASTGVARRSST